MKTAPSIIWNDHKSALSTDLIGGKALGLHDLQKIHSHVPLWATLSTVFFQKISQSHPELQKLLKKKNAQEIRDYIQNILFKNEEQSLLENVWNKISENGKCSVAVRSSAADEDGTKLSFAGQMDTFLQIQSFDAFTQAVRDCWASIFGDRAVAYRLQNGINPWEANIAVVVQQMVDAEISGVVFTVNPINSNENEVLVTSAYGLGEGLVSGQLDADTFVMDRKGALLEAEHANKTQKLSSNKTGGIYIEEITPCKKSSLSSDQLQLIHRLALKTEEAQGVPLDIEFSIANHKIYLLQARPITSLQKKDTQKIWDNSNITESYSGVTTPLTFSFIQKAYFAVYWQFSETIGVPTKQIFKNRYILSNMLGLIEGRVYYNLLNWYELVSLMPGFEYNKSFMEQMMGLQVIPESKPVSKGVWQKYFIELPGLLKVAAKMVVAHIQLPKQIKKFHTHFRKIYTHYAKVDYSKKTPAEILSIYRILEDEILWKWRSPITNDFEAMIFYGLLKKLTLKWGVDPDGILQNDLLSGEGDIQSTELISELSLLAAEIEKDPNLKSQFLNASPEDGLTLLQTASEFENIHQKFLKYLEKFGVRCINEMKLESIPIKDNPLFCISTMQSYLRSGITDPKEQKEREQSLRKNAEITLRKRLKGMRLFFYQWILKNARRAIKNRENQRFARTEAYSLIRTLVLAIGKQWESKKIIFTQRDIFYLTMDEIWSYIEGTSTCVNLKDLIDLRKKEFTDYESQNPDDHIETEGEVYFGNSFTKEVTETSEDLIKGLGCCSGIIEGKIKVVLSPDSNLQLNNEIMVAKQTDPGWGILFPSISGLIVEKGSMLSHSAIVAREMGIPAVIGVKNATKIFKSGDKVRLDGSEGTLHILEKAK